MISCIIYSLIFINFYIFTFTYIFYITIDRFIINFINDNSSNYMIRIVYVNSHIIKMIINYKWCFLI